MKGDAGRRLVYAVPRSWRISSASMALPVRAARRRLAARWRRPSRTRVAARPRARAVRDRRRRRRSPAPARRSRSAGDGRRGTAARRSGSGKTPSSSELSGRPLPASTMTTAVARRVAAVSVAPQIARRAEEVAREVHEARRGCAPGQLFAHKLAITGVSSSCSSVPHGEAAIRALRAHGSRHQSRSATLTCERPSA
mgnify:CR=1 FL=1